VVTERTLRRRFLSLRTLASFAIAATLLGLVWVLADLSLELILDHLSRANPWLIVAAYGVYAASFPLRTLRWRILLANAAHREEARPRYSLWSLFQILYISWFVNGIIPFKIGDLYRAYMVRANFSCSLTRTLGTIFTERVFDVVTLIGIVLGSSVFVLTMAGVGEDVGGVIFVAAVGLGALTVAVIAMLLFAKPVIRLFPDRIQGMYFRFHSGIFDSVTLRTTPLLLMLSVGVWFAEMGRLTLVTRSVGLELEVGAVLFGGAAASLLLAVPTPGGLGAVEGGLIGVFRLVGIGAGPAGAVAIVDRLISYWSVTVTGGLVFVATRLRK
jgi:uncharacterized protein (TIRG00374 family)